MHISAPIQMFLVQVCDPKPDFPQKNVLPI